MLCLPGLAEGLAALSLSFLRNLSGRLYRLFTQWYSHE